MASLKDIIKLEYQKCAVDPIHFMKKYCMIQHPIRGKIPFELYDFQEKSVNEFESGKNLFRLFSRMLCRQF